MDAKQEMLAKEVFKCHGCPDLKSPPVFLVGNPEAKIWVIGINPRLEDFEDVKESKTFEEHQKNEERYFFEKNVHSYFRDFRQVFGDNWLQKFQESIAHIDLVKCSSKKNKRNKNVECKCGKFLQRQIEMFKPRLIVCNGVPVCEWFEKNYNISIKNKTQADLKTSDGHEFTVIFSGFIGRIDNYAKKRLGMEIDAVLKTLG